MDYLSKLESIPVLAKKGNRFLAAFIDYALFSTAFFVIAYYIGERQISEDNNTVYHLNGFPALLVLAIWLALFPLSEGLTGQTFGKMLLNIRVVKTDYSKISFKNSIVRHLFDFVDYMPGFGIVGLLVAANNDKTQRVGDLVAKTIVVVNESKVS